MVGTSAKGFGTSLHKLMALPAYILSAQSCARRKNLLGVFSLASHWSCCARRERSSGGWSAGHYESAITFKFIQLLISFEAEQKPRLLSTKFSSIPEVKSELRRSETRLRWVFCSHHLPRHGVDGVNIPCLGMGSGWTWLNFPGEDGQLDESPWWRGRWQQGWSFSKSQLLIPTIFVTSFLFAYLGLGVWTLQWTHAKNAPSSRRLLTPPQWSGKSGVARFLWRQDTSDNQFFAEWHGIHRRVGSHSDANFVKAAGGTATKGARTAKRGRTVWEDSLDRRWRRPVVLPSKGRARIPVWSCETLHFVVNINRKAKNNNNIYWVKLKDETSS